MNFITYEPKRRYPAHINADGLGLLMLLFLFGKIFFIMEIICLVFFIRNYDFLLLFGKLGYFIHIILIPCIIIPIYCSGNINCHDDDDY